MWRRGRRTAPAGHPAAAVSPACWRTAPAQSGTGLSTMSPAGRGAVCVCVCVCACRGGGRKGGREGGRERGRGRAGGRSEGGSRKIKKKDKGERRDGEGEMRL